MRERLIKSCNFSIVGIGFKTSEGIIDFELQANRMLTVYKIKCDLKKSVHPVVSCRRLVKYRKRAEIMPSSRHFLPDF